MSKKCYKSDKKSSEIKKDLCYDEAIIKIKEVTSGEDSECNR